MLALLDSRLRERSMKIILKKEIRKQERHLLRSAKILLLSLGLVTAISAQRNDSAIEFEVFEKGETVPYDVIGLDEIEFKRYETNETLMYACFSNQADYKAIYEIDKKVVKIYKIKTALSVMGSIKNIVGLGLYLSNVKEFKKWGAGLMVLGSVEISIGLAI